MWCQIIFYIHLYFCTLIHTSIDFLALTKSTHIIVIVTVLLFSCGVRCASCYCCCSIERTHSKRVLNLLFFSLSATQLHSRTFTLTEYIAVVVEKSCLGDRRRSIGLLSVVSVASNPTSSANRNCAHLAFWLILFKAGVSLDWQMNNIWSVSNRNSDRHDWIVKMIVFITMMIVLFQTFTD
jgi:hypothetical protein